MTDIYQALAAVNSEIDAIAKDKKNKAQGFNFRGIDDAYNRLHDLLAKHNVITIPIVLEREQVQRETKSGGSLYFTCLKVEYRFQHAGGTHVSAVVFGEAMDSADKGTNKALAAAHKYALFQTFTIPTLFTDPDSVAEDTKPMATPEQVEQLKKAVQDGRLDKTQAEYLTKREYMVPRDVAARALKGAKDAKA